MERRWSDKGHEERGEAVVVADISAIRIIALNIGLATRAIRDSLSRAVPINGHGTVPSLVNSSSPLSQPSLEGT